MKDHTTECHNSTGPCFCDGMPEVNHADQSMKKDAGKPRWELLPFECIEGIVKVLTFGANKYEDDGWKQLMVNEEGYQRVVGSFRRHQLAMERDGILALDLNEQGEVDKDHSGLPHVDHCQCCLMFMKYYQLALAKKKGIQFKVKIKPQESILEFDLILDQKKLPCEAWERCRDYHKKSCFLANSMMDDGYPCFTSMG